MIDYDNNGKRIFYMVILVLTLIISLIGAAVALYSAVLSGDKEGESIYTGKLEINYIDGVEIENPILWPIDEPNLNTINNVYKNRFTVTSSGTLDQYLTIYLDITNNEFGDDAIKYSLYDSEGNKIKMGSILSSGKIILADNLYLKYNGVANYTMLLWLDDNRLNQNDLQGKRINGTISVLSQQAR